MDKERLIQLANAVYRLTLLFPKKEPLRYKMREVADDILTKPNEKDIEILDSFFQVAKAQSWVSPQEILAIQEEYDNLRGDLKKVKTEKKKENPVAGIELQQMSLRGNSNIERQERILAFLRENGRAQVWQIKQIFPEFAKRTLRRDFEHMLNQGLIERVGERNDTFYQIKVVEG